MINSKEYFIKHQIPFLLSLVFLSSFYAAYGQNPIKNKSLPEEIHLSANTKKIIDSIFVIKNEVQKLETVQLFELKNGIIISANRKYYVNDTLNQATNEIFDSNGNSIDSNTLLHFKNSNRRFLRKYDAFGNIIQLKTEENNRGSLLDYRNEYVKNKLASVLVVSNKSGEIIKRTSFKYDSKGNLTEELFKTSYLDAKSLNNYNKSNQVILHQHIRNGKLNDSILYHYENKLLIKKEWYENPPSGPMITIYSYNSKNQLILENEEGFGSRIEYKDYDSSDNWQGRYQYSYGKLNRITRRFFID